MHSNEDIKRLVEESGSTWLQEERTCSKILIKDKCLHPPYWMELNNFLHQGQRCPECGGTKRKDLAWVQRLAQAKGGKCLSTVYINNRTKMEWECALGHRWMAKFNGVTDGNWCPVCSGKQKKSLGWLAEIASKRQGVCLATEYVNMRASYLWRCKKGHQWPAVANSVLGGSWCPHCSTHHSKGELEIFEHIRKKYPDALNGVTKLLQNKRMELDIYIPSLKKAIEYDGGYWHFRPEVMKRDGLKCALCQEAGITLYRVLEDLYLQDKELTLQSVDLFLAS